MDYTIATMNDIHGNIEISFDRSGNKYVVGIYNKDTAEYTCKSIAEHAEAVTMFQKLATMILTGCGSYEDRNAMLS